MAQQYYLRARFYNPVVGRFTQEDTYRGDGLNLYAYCANNPVRYWDPSGYVCESKDPQGGPKQPESTALAVYDPHFASEQRALAGEIYQDAKGNWHDPDNNNQFVAKPTSQMKPEAPKADMPTAGQTPQASGGRCVFGELDALGRTTGFKGVVTSDMIGTGSPADPSIIPAGFGGAAAGHARGHLLGRQLGGPGDDPRNLMTLYQNPVNHPNMSGIEASIRKAVECGQIVSYEVTPVYNGDELIPRGVTISATGDKGFYIYQTLLNRK